MEKREPLMTSFSTLGRGLIFFIIILVFVGWSIYTPAGLLGKADAVGYAVCHRIDARSFHLGVRQLPLCARCSGMYLGAVLGLSYQAILGPRRGGMPSRRVWILLGLFVALFGLDGTNSYLHLFPGAPTLYEPQNWLRLLTGTGVGLAMALAIYPVFNQSVWLNGDRRSVFTSIRSLLPLFFLSGLLILLVLIENPLILYPLAIISAAGVLIILTMVYTVLWLVITKSENIYSKAPQLLFPLAAGFGTAILQIALLDFIRFLFTGTWDGFHLG